MFDTRTLSTITWLTTATIPRSTSQACDFPFKRGKHDMAPRRVPSSAGLPDNWTPDMDEFVCYSDAVGDLSVKVTIISLKKRFPQLGPHAISEAAIERRLYCLDRMPNNYFKKGSALAVSRLESAGIRLPLEPDHDMAKENSSLIDHQKLESREPVTPSKSSVVLQAAPPRMVIPSKLEPSGSSTHRYGHERYAKKAVKDVSIANEGHSSPKAVQPAKQVPAGSDDTVFGVAYEGVSVRAQPPVTRVDTSSSRPSKESSRRPKDVNPAASFSHLHVTEERNKSEAAGPYTARSVSNASAPSAKGSYNAPSDGLSLASSMNPNLGFSSGSPRQPHGRVRAGASTSNMPSNVYVPTKAEPRHKDENTASGLYAPTKTERRQRDENMPLPVHVPTRPGSGDSSTTVSLRL
ncbi:MAG: hypothetical protein Q9177_002914 [Variospora cf. flavescens]